MFELSVALKYLLPKWRQLSVSIISLISIVVISLVVWLIVVFFSVTYGLENSWVNKLVALTAPVRVSPTKEYYQSYYHLSDHISSNSDYTMKTIGEKLASDVIDPYDPDFDEEIPYNWSPADRNNDGEVKDLVKLAYQSIDKIDGVQAREYEMTAATLKLNLVRGTVAEEDLYLTQSMYLSSYDSANTSLNRSLLPVSDKDIHNLFKMGKDAPSEKLQNVLQALKITSLRTAETGWRVPETLFPENCQFETCVIKHNDTIVAVVIPDDKNELADIQEKMEAQGARTERAILKLDHLEKSLLIGETQTPLKKSTPLIIQGGFTIPVNKDFSSAFSLQGVTLSGVLALSDFEIDQFEIQSSDDFWLSDQTIPSKLPADKFRGEGILLPKSFREAGVLIGDEGHITYKIPTASAMQEQQLPVFVLGFYDPGILPMGGKVALANQDTVSMIRTSFPNDESSLSNGINVRFDDYSRAEEVKAAILHSFKKNGIEKYWKVETFREFEFSKDLLQQLRSEKNLFTLISAVIIIVACSNIISMLIILVNDKKLEIGILRSMGASSTSIATIFGFCGMMMGLVGSLVGIFVAILTLHNLQSLVDFISYAQGFEMFNPMIYGESLPNQLSTKTLMYVLFSTAIVSLLAGIVPAVKACMMRPSEILRSE